MLNPKVKEATRINQHDLSAFLPAGFPFRFGGKTTCRYEDPCITFAEDGKERSNAVDGGPIAATFHLHLDPRDL